MFILVLTLICALFVAVFAVQNAAPVVIRLAWFTTEIPLVIVILGSALAGALIVLLLAIWREVNSKRKMKALSAPGNAVSGVQAQTQAKAQAQCQPPDQDKDSSI